MGKCEISLTADQVQCACDLLAKLLSDQYEEVITIKAIRKEQ